MNPFSLDHILHRFSLLLLLSTRSPTAQAQRATDALSLQQVPSPVPRGAALTLVHPSLELSKN